MPEKSPRRYSPEELENLRQLITPAKGGELVSDIEWERTLGLINHAEIAQRRRAAKDQGFATVDTEAGLRTLRRLLRDAGEKPKDHSIALYLVEQRDLAKEREEAEPKLSYEVLPSMPTAVPLPVEPPLKALPSPVHSDRPLDRQYQRESTDLMVLDRRSFLQLAGVTLGSAAIARAGWELHPLMDSAYKQVISDNREQCYDLLKKNVDESLIKAHEDELPAALDWCAKEKLWRDEEDLKISWNTVKRSALALPLVLGGVVAIATSITLAWASVATLADKVKRSIQQPAEVI